MCTPHPVRQGCRQRKDCEVIERAGRFGGKEREVRNATMSQINSFVAVVEAGSITIAARRRGKSASVISEDVKALEIKSGSWLLTKHRGRFEPTRHGKVIYERCVVLLEMYEGLLRDDGYSAPLRIWGGADNSR